LVTVTVMLDVAAFPAASVALAVITCVPSVSPLVSTDAVQSVVPDAGTGWPPSTWSTTEATSLLSIAVPFSGASPASVEPSVGVRIAMVGGVVSHGLVRLHVGFFPATALGANTSRRLAAANLNSGPAAAFIGGPLAAET
jgi:hypothetical protein